MRSEHIASQVAGPPYAFDPDPRHRRSVTGATVAIIGLGGIGGVAAAYIRAAGRHRVMACARRTVDHIVVQTHAETLDVPLHAITDPAQAGPADWVLLCTKAHQTAAVAPWLARVCRGSTRVAVLQNGLGQVVRTAPYVGAATVVPTVVSYSAERLGEDRVLLRQPAEFDLAVGDDADGRDLAALFVGTPLRILLSDDLRALMWRKLLINCVANPITALTLRRLSVFKRPDVTALAQSLLEEAVSVARADGVKVTDRDVAQTLHILRSVPAEMTTSMHFDRLAGRELEVDALNGELVRAGERLGVSTPLHRAMLTLLRASAGVIASGTTTSTGLPS